MNNSSFPTSLVQQAKEHVKFLRDIHEEGVSVENFVSKNAFDRYVDKWLPLVKRNPATRLLPPPDIAWLWHCHRLAPLRYEDFCNRKYGRIIEANPAFAFQTKAKPDDSTQKAWRALFPNDPFFADKSACSKPVSHFDLKEKLHGFDLVSSAKAQTTFLWQVSGPKFQDDTFLLEGTKNYNKFIALSQMATDFPIVPTYQIDLMWHTHMLASIAQYNNDCIAIRGTKLNHDDSLNDRTAGAKLDVSFRKTCQLWKLNFGEEYAVEGGMYRGEPPSIYYEYKDWNLVEKSVEAATFKMSPGSGATSTGSSWLDPRMHPHTFQKREYVGGNNQRPGMVYGNGSVGYGYYSLQTRDAYEIMHHRLAQKRLAEVNKLFGHDCWYTLTCGICDSPNLREKKQKLRDSIEDLEVMIAEVQSRLRCVSPDQKIPVDQIEKQCGRRVKSEKTYTDPDTGFVFLSMAHYAPQECCNAAGCGANNNGTTHYYGGGGCGGGAACGNGGGDGGGGGCGGGGCGGGGCGGGGCGGGGCGG